MVDVVYRVRVPRVPNFIHIGDGSRTVPIGELSDRDLEKVADAWKVKLVERARQQRAAYAAREGDDR